MIEITGWEDAVGSIDDINENLRSIAQALKGIEATLKKKAEEEHDGLIGYIKEAIAMGGEE